MDAGKFLTATFTWVLAQLRHARFCVLGLKLELDPELDHTGRNICVESRSQNAGWGLLLIKDLAKGIVRAPIIGKSKIGMVKQIEKLKADGQDAGFPAWDLRIFHHCEVRVDVARASITVAALRKRYARAAAGTFRTW